MKKSRYSDTQIMNILIQAEGGVPVSELWTVPEIVESCLLTSSSFRLRM